MSDEGNLEVKPFWPTSSCAQGEKEEERQRDWASLPGNTLIIIYHKLMLADKLRAATVWGWKILIQELKLVNASSTWLLQTQYRRQSTQSHNEFSCQLVFKEPDNCERFCVTKIIACPLDGKWVGCFGQVDRTDYRFGWLLDSLRMRSAKSEFLSVFFYHPLDDSYSPKFLPSLYLVSGTCGYFGKVMATFSSPPTSPECVVFVVYSLPGGIAAVNTWRNGRDAWSRHKVEGLSSKIESVVHINGFLYCVTAGGSLVTFNSSNGAWGVTSPSIEGASDFWTPKLADLDGELVVFCVRSLIVYSHEGSRNAWIRKLRLYSSVLHSRTPGALSVPLYIHGYRDEVKLSSQAIDTTWSTLRCFSIK